MSLAVKDIGSFLLLEQFMSQQEINSTNIIVNKRDIDELNVLKINIPEFANLNLVEDEVKENIFMYNDLYRRVVCREIKHVGSRVYYSSKLGCTLPIKTPYVYVEDYNAYNNLDYLENLAQEKGFVYFSANPIVGYSKYFIIKRERYNILEKLHIMKNAIGYIGFDKSLNSNFAYLNFDENRRIIMPSGVETETDLKLKFYPIDDLSFIHDDFSEFMI